MRLYLVSTFLLVAGCAKYSTPQLPDIDIQSLSYIDIIQQKQKLQQTIEKMQQQQQLKPS